MTAPRQHGVLLLTGRPGIGKTTVIRRVAESVRDMSPAGFYTEEIRVAGERTGFRAVTFDGAECVIAQVRLGGSPRVGKYGVDVAAIDHLAQSSLEKPGAGVYLVDEIGKMETLSSRFVTAVRRLLDSRALVIATIGQRGEGFINEVKRRRDVELWEVTRENRDAMAGRVLTWLDARIR